MLLTLLLSLSIEVMQLILRVGVFDIDDIILNTAGGTIGYSIMRSKRMRKKQNIGPLILSVILILLVVTGCSQKVNKDQPGSIQIGQESEQAITKETEPQDTNQVLSGGTIEQTSQVFIQMLANHPLHRSGVLSPNKRYYAYEERSSIILVQLPAAEEYLADKTLVPRVLFTDGIRKDIPFTELENDYAKRMRQPLLTREELGGAELKLRSVYKWDMFHSLKFSQDGRYLGYLREQNFGSERSYTVYVLDLQDNCRLYSLPVKESSQYWGIIWQSDNETLEIHLPSAESIGEGVYLDLRRLWHIPSGQSKQKYYINAGSENEKEIPLKDAQKAIAGYAQVEAERKRAEEKWNRLTVDELVATLTPAELAEEYKRYFSLHPVQIELLKARGYSDEAIAKIDSYDFQQEESGWLLSKELIDGAKRIYSELKAQDLSNWTHQKYNEYIQVQSEKSNAPPDAIKKEILERGLPEDINSRVVKEFHGWQNMLAYTNEAIMDTYEASQQADILFQKAEACRLAVRAAYLEKRGDV